MGCGGSKDEIAAGNTVAAKSLQSNKPSTPNSSTNQLSEQKPSVPVVDSVASEKKEAAPAAPAEALISKESPDRYFSSRKDEEAIAGGNVLNKDEDQLLADSVSVVEDSSEVKKDVLIGGDGEAKIFAEVPKSEDEKASAEGGKDSKGTSYEEKVSEENAAKKKN
ncbi:uncharacterized protein LOC110027661 [Phalaenopsis equestris]|uniref:uncharacterized protein LOC110027661 n=1 Tax=Phalaenopsis equestris TaxID=78828 RepID=UPI0009E5EC7E|nr:uncharacterized protein LOC110027661 [Phalaenopsis equestris]